ncbi:MAG: PilZ domain-containing protein [Oligoflexales bacterium]|nr:PilZ domain-containing protein [Oligoflexales bacterium]
MTQKESEDNQIISNKRFLIWYSCILVTMFSLHFSDLGDFAELDLAHRMQFNIRARFDLAPKLHKKLKIYALDDYAVRKISRDEIRLTNWSSILTTISKSKPKMIIIDKEFGLINEDEDLELFSDALTESVPIYIGCHTKARENRLKKLTHDRFLNLDRPEFNLSYTLLNKEASADWLPILDHDTFGPKKVLEEHFHGIGHINYEYVGRVEPFRRVSENVVIPHLTLLTADSLRIADKEVIVDQIPVRLDNKNLIAVNFPTPNELYKNTKSIYPVYRRATQNRSLKKIKEDDIVLILPLFFTGNTDMGNTPIGRVPRGFIMASLINSILNKDWLVPLNIAKPLIPIGALLGAMCGMLLSPVWFWVVMLSLCSSFFMGSMALFSFFGIIVPWLTYILSFLIAGVVFFSVKMSRQARISQAYEIALSGLVSHNSLKELIKNPAAISREASEQLLTIMFLDMVAFSSMAENAHPRVVFSRLKETMGHFSAAVHKFGGVVDKTMGDGMLCFFGYNYIGGSTTKNHANQAIACAKEIQIEHSKRSIEKFHQGEPYVPIRIGINSAKVYIGDLGNKERIDFTLIGNGVNFAQRLEAACDPFSILLSEDSLQFANDFHLGLPGIRRRKIKIKHHQKLFNVIEFLPFIDHHDILEHSKEAFYGHDQYKGRAPRWPVDTDKNIVINTSEGDCRLINFSRTGYALLFPHELEEGITFDFNIHMSEHFSEEFTKINHIPSIKCEVRWTNPEEGKILHGVSIVNLNEQEKELFYECLRDSLTKIT